MIIMKCDLCNKPTTDLKTIILHKKSIDYCSNCETKAKEIKNNFKEKIKQEYLLFEGRLKKTEINFYNSILKKED